MQIPVIAAAIIILLCTVKPGLSEEVRRVYQEGEVPAVNELLFMFREEGSAPAPKSRLGKRKSFRDSALDDSDDLPAEIASESAQIKPPQTATGDQQHVVAIPIRFKRNAEVIAPSEVKILENIAQAMLQVGGDARFLVEGHTDATGSDSYNMKLSLLRALSVKDQLVRHGVPAQLLTVAGSGSTKLLDAANPNAGANRRVEFKRITVQ